MCFTCFFDLQTYVVVVFVCVVLFVSSQKWICKHLTVEISMARLAVLNTTSKYGSLILWHATFWLRDVLRNIHKMATVVSQVVQVVMTDAFMIVDWCRLHNHCNDSKGVLHRKHDHRIYVRTCTYVYNIIIIYIVYFVYTANRYLYYHLYFVPTFSYFQM